MALAFKNLEIEIQYMDAHKTYHSGDSMANELIIFND